MKKKLIIIIAAAVLLLVISAVAIYFIFFKKDTTIHYPEGTVGNTAGNLNNGGLFCEKDGVVYFANARDNGYLYSMDPDEGNLKKLGSISVLNLMCAGNDLYYSQLSSSTSDGGLGYVRGMHSLNKCKIDGSKAQNINFDLIINAQLVNDTLYVLTTTDDAITFYKQNVNEKEQVPLAEYSINPSCVVDGCIYFSDGHDNHALMKIDTATDTLEKVYGGTTWNPCYYDGYIYYMDVMRDYCLCRYSLSGGTAQILTEDRVDCFNIGQGYIYYQCVSKDGNCLKMMETDGSNVYTLAMGNYSSINMTSKYVYFQDFGVNGSLYHSQIGSLYFEPFQ